MNAKQSARRRAIVAVLAVLNSENNKPLWSPKPALARAVKKQLPQLLRQAAEILNDRIDGLIAPFKASEPAFYNEYQAARLIVDAASGRNGNGGAHSVGPITNAVSASAQIELKKAA